MRGAFHKLHTHLFPTFRPPTHPPVAHSTHLNAPSPSLPLVITCSIKNVQFDCIPSDIYYYYPELNMLFICTVFLDD